MLNQYNVAGLTVNQLLKEIGEAIRRKRINRQLTQRNLADRTGVNINTIIGLEQGKNVGIETFLLVIKALDELAGLYNFLLMPEPIAPSLLFKLRRKQPKRVKPSKKQP